ncbi:hypothetical protein MC885_021303 [Smutsia gigantea]|nr:hypothetical protein MC885_021303 [Smutsia gigantea]
MVFLSSGRRVAQGGCTRVKSAVSAPWVSGFSGDQDWDRDRDHDQDWDQDREQDRRGRSRELESRDGWPSARSPQSSKRWLLLPSAVCLWTWAGPFLHEAVLFPGLPQRGLSLPVMEKTALAVEREHQRRGSMMDYESRSQVVFLHPLDPTWLHSLLGAQACPQG